MRFTFTLILLLFSAAAFADEQEIARDHYDRGAALYDATRYESALHEFETAYTQEPRPALVFNIARCLDRLGRRTEAAAAYERFIENAPDATSAASARARLDAIRVIVQPAPVVLLTPITPPRRRSHYLGPGILLGGALAIGAIGAGLTGSALVSYHSLSDACSPNCNPAAWSSLPPREHAGEALLGVAAAAVVADVIWFVIESRKGR